jgi:hypothetical protein
MKRPLQMVLPPAQKFPSLPVLDEGAKETIDTQDISEAQAVAERQQSS